MEPLLAQLPQRGSHRRSHLVITGRRSEVLVELVRGEGELSLVLQLPVPPVELAGVDPGRTVPLAPPSQRLDPALIAHHSVSGVLTQCLQHLRPKTPDLLQIKIQPSPITERLVESRHLLAPATGNDIDR